MKSCNYVTICDVYYRLFLTIAQTATFINAPPFYNKASECLTVSWLWKSLTCIPEDIFLNETRFSSTISTHCAPQFSLLTTISSRWISNIQLKYIIRGAQLLREFWVKIIIAWLLLQIQNVAMYAAERLLCVCEFSQRCNFPYWF